MADKVVPVDVRALIVSWPEEAPRGAVTRFCVEHSVSRSQFYEIWTRARGEGSVAAMLPRPRSAPARHPQAVPIAVEELAVAIRKELADTGWDHGPLTVRHRLLTLGIAAPAASTLARIFTRRGMVVPQPGKRPKTSWRRFEAAAVHECWQLDGFEWPLADGTVFTVLQVTDDKTRFPIATRAAPGERAKDAITVIQAGIDRFQVPCRVLTDNGAAFNQERIGRRTKLVTKLMDLGCRPVTGRPDHPQTQGKNERAHQTLQRWLRAQDPPQSLADAQRLLDSFDEQFAERPHQGLQMRTPAQALSAGPVAVPPRPPDPAQPDDSDRVKAYHRRVAANGNCKITGTTVQLGAENAGTTITAIRAGRTINVFDHRGKHISTIHLEPGRTYYSNGRPRGRRPKPKRPD